MADVEIYTENGKLIKLYLSDTYEYVEQAYHRQRFVHSAGLPVPAAYGIKRINETQTALEMEYINGKPLVDMYEGKGEEMLAEANRIMVRLQCQIASVDASGLPNLTDFYKHEIATNPYLTEQKKDELLALMRSFGREKTNLCHGDIHPHNIMYNGDKYWIIDWEEASNGDPAADACMSYFYTVRWAAKGNNRSAEQYLQMFCEESGILSKEVLAWLPVIAGVQSNINDDEDRRFILEFINRPLA